MVRKIRAELACVTAGLSPELQTLEQLRNIKRPTQIPDAGLTCDLLWSDPDPDAKGWGESDRGVSFTFGADVVAKFLQRTDLDLVCRAHQVRTVSPRDKSSEGGLRLKADQVWRAGDRLWRMGTSSSRSGSW